MTSITQREFRQQFRVGKQLGQGGFGKVFRAWDNARGEHVALKFISTRGDVAQSLVEYDIARRVASPYSVRYYNAFVLDPPISLDRDAYDLVLEVELIVGLNLYQYTVDVLSRMKPQQRWPFFVHIAGQTLQGLCDIHREVAHQDIKGENIMLSVRALGARPEDVSIKYVDYGLSCRKRAGLIMSCRRGAQSGTLIYMSPDRALLRLGELQGADPYKNDIYGLGRVLLEVAMGRVLYICGGSIEEECLEDVVQQVGVVSGLRELDIGTPAQTDAIRRLLFIMLAPTDDERPTAVEALRMFHNIKAVCN